jgi:hypothetical protein
MVWLGGKKNYILVKKIANNLHADYNCTYNIDTRVGNSGLRRER